MRTNKIFTLHKLIDWLNIKDKDLNIEKKGLNTNSLISDAWLSGFIDADGHFSVRTTESGKYPKIEWYNLNVLKVVNESDIKLV